MYHWLKNPVTALNTTTTTTTTNIKFLWISLRGIRKKFEKRNFAIVNL